MSNRYILHINTRNYSNWSWINEETQESISKDKLIEFPFPVPNQLFHGDHYCKQTEKLILDSPLRTEKAIIGTLLLSGNRTYGRQVLNKPKTTNNISLFSSANSNGNGRLYYRCIPQNPKYPIFLVPYNPPLEFSKHTSNQFVLFQFKEWKDKIAPYGGLIETIGAVNHLPSYYRYLLLSKKLEFHPNHWIPVSLRNANTIVASERRHSFEKRVEKKGEFVFSIDPEESRDLDDAFSFTWRETENGKKEAVVRIYIADVVYWMDWLGKWDVLRLENMGCSTIYLPDQNHPLLPRWISDKEGSLLESKTRPVVGLEKVFRCNDGDGSGSRAIECISQQFFRDSVTISKNFRYDTSELDSNPEYKAFLEFTRELLQTESRTGKVLDMKDSHDLVEYWMIEYNICAGNALAILGKGIFRRIQTLNRDERKDEEGGMVEEMVEEMVKGEGVIGINTRQFLKHYKNMRGEYVLYDDKQIQSQQSNELIYHNMIREGKYVFYAHASSPLRRMVDIYNQLGLVIGISRFHEEEKGAIEDFKENIEVLREEFQAHVEANVGEINRQNRIARRIQNECELLTKFFFYDMVEVESYEGIVVDWDICRSDSTITEVKGYWVFLEFWKHLVYVKRQKQNGEYEPLLKIGETGKYQIFLFEEEEKAHRKIVVRRCVLV